MAGSRSASTGGSLLDAGGGRLRLLGWCGALAVTLVVLHQLPVPDGPIDLTSRDAADVLPVLLRAGRWIALACTWYLMGATVLSAVSALVRWRPLRRLDHALSVPVVRHVVRAGLGATLAVGMGLGPTASAAAAPGPPGASGTPAPLTEQLDEARASDPAGGRNRAGSDGGARDVSDSGGSGSRGTRAQPPPLERDGDASALGDEIDDPLGGPSAGLTSPDRRAGAPPARAPLVADPADPADGNHRSGTTDTAREPRDTDEPSGSAEAGSAAGPDSTGGPGGRAGSGGTVAPRGGRTTSGTADTPDAAGDAERANETDSAAPRASDPAGASDPDGEHDAEPDGDHDAEPDGADDAEIETVTTHRVVEGESFWTIAADLTEAALGRPPDDTEIFERWVELMDANRDRLLIPGDPDLLRPGQELVVPPPLVTREGST